jgi:predicted short-subunit dehydrogenase-like oxidoreductase (DUF2520 family)
MNVTFIGAGNLATHLAKEFVKRGHIVRQIFSRNLENAELLAKGVAASPTDSLQQIDNQSDIYIIALKDDIMPTLSNHLNLQDKICVHTSGSVPMEALNGLSSRIGVFYPLQQFNKSIPIDIKKIPLLIEASDKNTLEQLHLLGKTFSERVEICDSETRFKVHLTAVMTNNFVHHLVAKSKDFADLSGFNFDLLHPLLEETFAKIKQGKLKSTQTGPARRKDFNVIDKHLDTLHDPQLKQIYQTITDSIVAYYD